MDKNIRYISKDIRNGKLLEENIPQLFNHLANHYNIYSEIRLAMHYFAFYESFCDDEGLWSKEALEITDQLNAIIGDSVLKSQNGMEREKAIKGIDAIRKDITKRMDTLTAYTDIFQTYEYVLNRLEYRFKGDTKSFEEDDFEKEILRYIFNSEDNFIINEKIKDIIGQLPIRITKQKYFELLRGSLQAYLGADASSFDTYLYMIKTSAMLYQVDSMESLYPGLWERKDFLTHISYKDITKEDYDKALRSLQAVTMTLETETFIYFALQEIVNEVYTLLLCAPYAGMVSSDAKEAEDASISIIREINGEFIMKKKNDLSTELTMLFTDVEGVQEEMTFDIAEMEDAIYHVKINHKSLTQSLMLEPQLQVLLRSQSLLSNSLFINLEEESQEEETVDEERVEKEANTLEAELTTLFNQTDRMISRAVMANTLNKMPVFFADHKEVMDYVKYSLERCSDLFEKAACYEIIGEIMKEE